MNAKQYRTIQNLSPIDFPAVNGLCVQSTLTFSDPPSFANKRLVLKITKTFLLTESFTNKEHEIFRTQSVYEIPINVIIKKEDLYEFYQDAELSLSEAYEYVQKQVPLPPVQFPPEPIENYQKECDSIFQFISSLN